MSKLTFDIYIYSNIEKSTTIRIIVTNSVKFRAWLPDIFSRATNKSSTSAGACAIGYFRHIGKLTFLILKWIVAILRVILDIWLGRKMVNKQFIRFVVDLMQKKRSFGLKLTRIIEGRSIQTTNWGGVYKSRIID